MTQEEIKKWHNEENAWWNRFANIMSEQWTLNTFANKIIRSKLEKNYMAFLYKEQGNLLDIGCGSGWLSIKFAAKGMDTLGIDFSQEQIIQANHFKKSTAVDNANFICADFIDFPMEQYQDTFDSVFINAFLHHLPNVELEEILLKVSKICKKDAKIYLYEPLIFSYKETKIVSILLKIYNRILSVFMWHIPSLFHFWTKKFQLALREGYNGMSPKEASIDYDTLCAILKKANLHILNIAPEHYQSLPFAILTCSMRQPYKTIYSFGIPIIFILDKILFKFFKWQTFGKKRNFLLCSIQLKKL